MSMHEKLELRRKREARVNGSLLKTMPYIFIIFLISIITLGIIL